MTDKKTPLKTKVRNFLEKHENEIFIGAVTVLSYAAGIAVSELSNKGTEALQWRKVEKHEFFEDADEIARTKDGRFFAIKKVDEEKYANA